MSTELKQAAEKALVVLRSATSFMSRKARDQHESVVAELRTAIQQAEAQQTATGEPVGYMNDGHLHELAMRRLPYGYVYPEAGAGASTAVYTHPALDVPDGWTKDLFLVVHAMEMNNWHWKSSASNDLKREAHEAATRLYTAAQAKGGA